MTTSNIVVGGSIGGSGGGSVTGGGNGTLTVRNGGAVTAADNIYLGRTPGSKGVVTVDGSGSAMNSSSLWIGYGGTGNLSISDGGRVANTTGIIGSLAGSQGTVTVDGADSKWTNSGALTVGSAGQGTLILSNNGFVSATGVSVGGQGTIRAENGGGQIDSGVTVASGGTLAGASGGTLTMGALTLDSGSMINVSLGAASTTEVFKVNGNLTLNGTLNVTNAGGFGNGLYRLIDYTGTLTDNGLDIGATPTGYAVSDLTVQSDTTDKQINLIVGTSSTSGDGPYFIWNNGNGVWSAANTNWSNAGLSATGVYDNTNILIFEGAGGGMVTVDGGGAALPISAGGLQFANDGFTITGDGLQLAPGANTIRVGDGTAAGAGYNATIASAIIGSGNLVKTDFGTLTLTGTNTYTGATTLEAGTLALSGIGSIAASNGVNLATGGVFDISGTTAGATIKALGNTNIGETGEVMLGSRTLTITGGGTFGGVISGEGGGLTVAGGTLTLTGDNTYTGLTTINNSVRLYICDATHSGSIMGTVSSSGYLFFYNASSAGTATITNNNDGWGMAFFDNSTASNATINNNDDTLTFFNNSTAGNATINNNNVMWFKDASTAGNATINNSGTAYFQGNSTAGDARLVNGAGRVFDFSGTTGPIGVGKISAGSIAGGGSFYLGGNELTVGGNNDSTTVSGVISGTGGSLIKTGAGTLTLTGTNTYTGGTTISAGTLQIAPTSTTSQTNLGTGAVNIASGGTLLAATNGGFSFNNALTGNGLLTANNGGGAFNFGSGAGSAFAGTVALSSDTFNLSGTNTMALTSATLVLGAGNTTTVGTSPQTIGGLRFDGGMMIFDASAPDQKVASDLVTVTNLDVSGTGTVQINVPNPYALPTPTPSDSLSLFAQSHVNNGLQLVAAGGVTGSAGGLTLQDQNGNALGQDRNVNISQNGNTVAIGHYNYMLGTGSANDGLYVGYGLNQLDLQAGQTLTLTENAGATGNDADLAAKLTGAGNLKIAANSIVSLSNPTNSFTGTTEISSGTLQAGAANVLASSSQVTIDVGAAFNLNNFNQGVNNLQGAGVIDVKTATLTATNNADSLFSGFIQGSGNVIKTGAGKLSLSGNSSTYTGVFTLAAGGLDLASTAKLGGSFTQNAGTTLTSTNGATLGAATFSGTVTPAGALNLASGTFNGATVNLGLLTAGNSIAATGAVGFTGPTTTINVNASGITSSSNFVLMSSGTSLSGASDAVVNATNLGTNRGGQYFTATTLNYGVIAGNASLTWNGTSSAWNTNTTNQNWNAGFATYFMTGDSVLFDTTATNKVVNVDSAGVSVGTMTVSAPGYTFNLTAGSTPAITATGAIDLGNAALNITGYTPDTSITSYPPGGNVETVVTASGGITNFNPLVTVTGQSSVDFLSASAYQNGNNINVETRLTWYSTDPNRKANGNFTIADGQTFTLGAALANNTTNLATGWDGTTLTKLGAGTLILTGANTYTGGTTISAGTLEVGNGGTTGSITGNIVNNTNVIFNRSDAVSYGGIISGAGSLTKTGDGTLTLTGNNTYAGVTEVQAGTLALSGAGRVSSVLALHEGATFATGGANVNYLSQLGVYGSAYWNGDLNMAGQTMNFYLPTTMAGGETALSVSGSAAIGGATVNVGIAGENPLLQPGNTITLINAASLTGAPGNSRSDNQWMIGQGATIEYVFQLSETANQLVATISNSKASEQSKSLSEGFVSGPALVNQTTDLLADKGIAQAVEATGGGKQGRPTMAAGYGLGTFGAISGGWNRYNTGSNADLSSLSLMAGLAWGNDLKPGRLTLGVFFEYGNGSYDTYNSFAGAPDARGDGNIYHLGGGILGHLNFGESETGNFYTEASARAGSVHNDYKNGNLGGYAVSYETDSAYYGLHAGAGYIWRLDEKMSLDLYGKYFWTRQNGDSARLSTGDPIRFDSIDSHRLRAGGRFSYAVNDFINSYAGLAYEHELDGEAKATAYDQPISAPSLQGGTGIGELGLAIKPTKNMPLSLDLGVQGYVGTREGFTVSAQARYDF